MNSLDKYISSHTSEEHPTLQWLVHQTHLRTNYARMLSGQVQGWFLTLLCKISGAKNILEIGTFTGYSTIAMALGLGEDGHIDSIEINDELEDLILEGFARAGVSHKISLHIGDALECIDNLKHKQYDLVFIDANKREYPLYYQKVLPLLRSGGLIIADDVLWDGKPYSDKVPADKQTQGICSFNTIVSADHNVEVVMLPLRHGISLIRKK